VPRPEEQKNAAESNRAPRAGIRLMIIIVLGITLLAIYANVQKARRNELEKVTIIPISTPLPASPSPSSAGR
jgi:hypothetical protein